LKFSVQAVETMEANSSTDMSLGDCPLSGHVNCAFPYILDALNFFSTYVEDL